MKSVIGKCLSNIVSPQNTRNVNWGELDHPRKAGSALYSLHCIKKYEDMTTLGCSGHPRMREVTLVQMSFAEGDFGSLCRVAG